MHASSCMKCRDTLPSASAYDLTYERITNQQPHSVQAAARSGAHATPPSTIGPRARLVETIATPGVEQSTAPGGRASGMARQLGCGGESNRRLRVRDRLPSQRPKPSRHGKLLQGVLLCVCVYAYAAVLHAIVGQHNLLVHRRRRCHPERGDPCVWMPPGELRSVLCSWRELRGLCPKHASRSIRVGARQDRTARAKRGTNSTVYIIIVAQGHGAPSTLVGRVVAHASTKSDARDPVDGRIPSCQ